MNPTRTFRCAAAGLALLAAACADDPVAPGPPECPAPCVAAAAYLRLDAVGLVDAAAPAGQALPLWLPGVSRIAYVVTNTGDTVSAPASVTFTYLSRSTSDEVPALAPGESVRREHALDFSDVSLFRFSDVDRARLLLHAPPDSATSYSTWQSGSIRFAIPLLSVELVADSLRVRAGKPLEGDHRVVNRSRHAASPPLRLAGCLYDGFLGCYPQYRTLFGSWNVPALPPQGTHTLFTELVIPRSAAWQDEDLHYSVTFCAVPTDHRDPYLPFVDVSCGGGAELLVRPDYEACAPPLLVPGSAHTFASYNCGLRPPTTQVIDGVPASSTELGRFHLVAIDVTAGTTYRLARSAGVQPLRFYDADGVTQEDLDPAADRIRFQRTGRTYLVLYTPQPALTVTLAEP